MKRIITAACAAAMLLTACGQKNPQPTEGSKVGFALSFFQKTNATIDYDENLLVSPYSAGVALSMVAVA